MSKINLNNYEAFMLDHLEGNLSPQDVLALKAFALLHPELELNFNEDLVTLDQEKFIFEGKKDLKATFSDELVIGYLENVLEGKEKQEAETLAAHNILFKQELDLYKRTIAVADTTIVFENKESLKRRGAVILLPQNNYVRVAAALLLLLGLWFTISRMIKDDVSVNTEMAKKTNDAKEMKSNATVSDNIKNNQMPTHDEKQIAKSSASNHMIKHKEEKVIANIIDDLPENNKEERNIVEVIKDRDQPLTNRDTNLTLLANNHSEEKLMQKYIIEEGVDEEVASTKPKSKLWNITSGLLKRLNKRGMENVNSSDNNNEMFIGALTISKPN